MNGAWWDVLHILASERHTYIGVQETHLKRETRDPSVTGYKIFRSEDPDEPKRGVMLAVHCSVGGRQVVHSSKKGSELWVLSSGFPFSQARQGLIGVIHLHPQATDEVNAVCTFITKAAIKYDVVLLGDFNSELPAELDSSQPFFGSQSRDAVSRLTTAMQGMVPRYRGRAGSHLARGRLTEIDAVIIPRAWIPMETCATVRLDLFGSDHYPVQVQGKWPRGAKMEPVKRRALTESQLMRVTTSVLAAVDTSEVTSVDDLVVLVQDMVRHELLKPDTKKGRHPSTPEIQRLRRIMQKAVVDSHRDPEAISTPRVKEARQNLSKAIWESRVSHWQAQLETLYETSKSDAREYFRQCKRLGKMQPPRTTEMTLASADGVALSGTEAEVALRQHFEQILAPRQEHDDRFLAGMSKVIQEAKVDEKAREHWKFVMEPVGEEELERAIMQQPRNTATGPDDIPAILWRMLWMHAGMRATMLRTLSSILETGDFPSSWRSSGLVPIPKVPHPKVAKEYRGIAVTNCLYRIFMRVLQSRISCALETNGGLSGSQFGFRRSRSTVEGVTALQEVIQRRMSTQEPTYVLFLDFATAYDSIHMATLRAALTSLHAPDKLTDLIVNCYSYTDVTITFPTGGKQTFRGTCGLRQGCTLSPVMFLVVIEQLLRELATKSSLEVDGVTAESLWSWNNGQALNNLFFADDGALLAGSAEELQELANVLVRWSRRWGLQLNPKKCIGMKFSSERRPEQFRLVLGTARVAIAEQFKYLGCLMDRKGNTLEMAEDRMTQARSKVGMLRELSRRLYHAKFQTRERITTAIARGAVLYGSEIWMWGNRADDAREIMGSFAQGTLGFSSKSNRTIAMLEAGIGDPAVSSMRKRIGLGQRIRAGGGSPAQVLWGTAGGRCSIMDRMILESEAVSGVAGLGRTLHGPHRKSAMDEMTGNQLLAESTITGSVKNYIREYYGSAGQAGEIYQTGDNRTSRAIAQMRTGCFWFWPRRRHLGIVALDVGCVACRSQEEESVGHLFLRCPRWAEARESHLKNLAMEGSESEVARQLLGGKGCKEKWQEETLPQVQAFLDNILPQRSQLMEYL